MPCIPPHAPYGCPVRPRLVTHALFVSRFQQLALSLAPTPTSATRLPYPRGVCTPSTDAACFTACEGATCGNGATTACGVLRYEAIKVKKHKPDTHCVPDFGAPCDGADQAQCDRCSLWRMMTQGGECVDAAGVEPAGGEPAGGEPAGGEPAGGEPTRAARCERHGWWAVMSAQEKSKEGKGLCASKDHWVSREREKE